MQGNSEMKSISQIQVPVKLLIQLSALLYPIEGGM